MVSYKQILKSGLIVWSSVHTSKPLYQHHGYTWVMGFMRYQLYCEYADANSLYIAIATPVSSIATGGGGARESHAILISVF